MISEFAVLILLIGIVIFVHLGKERHNLNRKKIIGIVLLWSFVIGVGFSGMYAFIGHTFFADAVARSIGWPVGNPFQQEVANANLVFGILGLLCYKFRDNFWLATAIGWFIFMVGAGIGHLYQMIEHGNFAPNNAGSILIYDLVFPVFILILVLMHRMSKKQVESTE